MIEDAAEARRRLGMKRLEADDRDPFRERRILAEQRRQAAIEMAPIKRGADQLVAGIPAPQDLVDGGAVAHIDRPAIEPEFEMAERLQVIGDARIAALRLGEDLLLPGERGDMLQRLAHQHEKARIGKQARQVGRREIR